MFYVDVSVYFDGFSWKAFHIFLKKEHAS